jgi:hypothetical protein
VEDALRASTEKQFGGLTLRSWTTYKGRTWTERTSWTLLIVFLFEATSRQIGGFSGGIFVVRCARKTDLKQR